MSSVITQDFIAFAREHFRLDWDGIHGAPHWSRVRRNGLLLAQQYAVDVEVVQWFAFIHDLERKDDYGDHGHGQRAAELAAELNPRFMGLSAERLALLQSACARHSDGEVLADPTVMVCWDADRLDLARVGIEPEPGRLCTAYARQPEVIAAACRRAVPDLELFLSDAFEDWDQGDDLDLPLELPQIGE